MDVRLIRHWAKHPIVKKALHPLVQKYDPYNDPNSKIEADDWSRGLPEYRQEDLNEDDSWWDWIVYFKYAFNVVFIVIPMAIIETIFIGYNLFFNIEWNYWWANGNVWLLVNTVYLFW